MPYQNILLAVSGPIATIIINRAHKMNALNTLTFDELNQALDEIENKSEIRGLFIKGAGEKAFVAGADIAEIQALDHEQGRNFSQHGQRVFDRIEQLHIPVIALIDGYALGGGCELALACHLRIASERSVFGQPEVNLGLVPGYGATQRLPRLIGKGLASQYLLTAELIKAERAFEIGLVNHVVNHEELESAGSKCMNLILSKGPLAVKNIIELVNKGLDLPLRQGLDLEAERFGQLCATEDKREGTQAFLEKRKPGFTGR